MDKLPFYSADLIKALDELVPPRCIGSRQAPEDAHRYAGKRELVEFLIGLLDESTATPSDSILR